MSGASNFARGTRVAGIRAEIRNKRMGAMLVDLIDVQQAVESAH
jgi:hypothetical protein